VTKDSAKKGYLVAQLDELPPVRCPCGTARRAFGAPENRVASLHLVDIAVDAEAHYHRELTEIYYVLEGEGHLEIDGDRVPLRPGTAVLIRPGARHRAVGKLRILNIPVPAFDPADEHFD
jgi:mannose-6-phosphate isomerase-like protein (cupin superfamily)